MEYPFQYVGDHYITTSYLFYSYLLHGLHFRFLFPSSITFSDIHEVKLSLCGFVFGNKAKS